MAWGRALRGVRFVRVDATELRDFLHGSVEVTHRMREFFGYADPEPCDQAMAAMLGRRCVAMLSFRVQERHGVTCLVSRGTYVRLAFRRHGLARALWKRALIAHAECEHVTATVTSRGGRKLLEGLAQRNPDVVFRINDLYADLVRVLRAA